MGNTSFFRAPVFYDNDELGIEANDVATWRPELIPKNGNIVYHPEDGPIRMHDGVTPSEVTAVLCDFWRKHTCSNTGQGFWLPVLLLQQGRYPSA